MTKDMKNPGVQTLYAFLSTIKEKTPAAFNDICEAKNNGYGMVSRYIKFSLSHNLIEVVEERKTRGRYPSKLYGLTDSGEFFLEVFKEMEPGTDESTDRE